MSGINGVVAAAAGRAETSIDLAVLSKAMQQAEVQQQGLAELVDAALETARAAQDVEPGKGAIVDVYA